MSELRVNPADSRDEVAAAHDLGTPDEALARLLLMTFKGQGILDVVILTTVAIFTTLSIGYIIKLWSMRHNFFIVLRSPRLACTLGFCISLRYLLEIIEFTIHWGQEDQRERLVVTLISFPAFLTAELAVIMTAVRLLIMYYPSLKATWGRYTKERPLVVGLVCGYAAIEIALWSAVGNAGLSRVASFLDSILPFSAVAVIGAAVCLGGRLFRIDDLRNMSHDISLVGATLLGTQCLHAVMHFLPMPPLAGKYFTIVFLTISHPPIVWICIIRPVQAVLRHVPGRRRSKIEILLVPPQRKFSASTVAVAADHTQKPGRNGDESCDSNRLASIMRFLPLREAFGEFCRRSLCSESFQFLLDASEFKEDLLLDAAANGEEKKGFKGFGGYSAVVNDYIKDGSHSEVNIEFKTKREIMKFAKFKDYASLDLDGRLEIFSAAEEEIGKMLVDNLLNRFLSSSQYKVAVGLEGLSGEK